MFGDWLWPLLVASFILGYLYLKVDLSSNVRLVVVVLFYHIYRPLALSDRQRALSLDHRHKEDP